MSLRIAILGAGISGLAAAWFLKEALGPSLHLTLIEKSSRVGGWIKTCRPEGFLFEQGPRSCRTKGKGRETLALIEALNLQDQILIPHPDAHSRFLYDGKKLCRLPRHLWEIPFHPLTSGWLKACLRDWRSPKRQEEDETIHAFFSRRLGRQWAEELIDPVVSGIYAGDIRRLSLKSTFPLFDEWEQKQGSLLKGAWHQRSLKFSQTPFIQKISRHPIFSFREGMETLPLALMGALKESLLLGRAAIQLNAQKQGVEIVLDNGDRMMADRVISTLPTFGLAPLLMSAPILSDQLKRLPYASVAVINAGFQGASLNQRGFGYLVPSKFGLPVLGCVWDSSIFPEQNGADQTRLTLMMGGSHHPEVMEMPEGELKDLALQVLRSQMGIRAEPQVMQVNKALHAIPQFEVGHSVWKSEIESEAARLFPRLILSGSAWTGVSMNDCISEAKLLVELIMAE